jgi:hypothetical protein
VYTQALAAAQAVGELARKVAEGGRIARKAVVRTMIDLWLTYKVKNAILTFKT